MAPKALLAHVVALASFEPNSKKASALPVETFETITDDDQFSLAHANRVAPSRKTDALLRDLGDAPLH